MHYSSKYLGRDIVGGHFVKKIQKNKLRIDLKWPEMRSKVILRPSKMAASGHFVKKNKNKVPYGSEMTRNTIQSDFQTSKMVAGKMARIAI